MKLAFFAVCALVTIAISVRMISHFKKPEFPWDRMVLEDASLSSSLDFNPYSDYPPKHRWQLGVEFRDFHLSPDDRSDAPFLTYSLDLDHRSWKPLPGVYELSSSRGSDFWHGDDNLGPVSIERIEIKSAGAGRYEIVLDLFFQFENGAYRPQKKRFSFAADYEGVTFFVPMWNEPDEVSFPSTWHVPSSKPHWSDDDIRTFMERFIDLSQYDPLQIDHSGSSSKVRAKPKGITKPVTPVKGEQGSAP